MKRLVCSLDGTWNEDDGASPATNVAKLHRAILPADARGVRQYVRYIAGIATEDDQKFNFLRGALGLDIGDRIKAGYEFLSYSYEPGDEIFLFGFSRGAYEARSLASFIALYGIARKGADFPIEEAWKLYRKSDHARDVDAVARLSAACHYPVRIRCIGVWDTVGNIGIPFSPMAWLSRQFAFHDMRLHDTIDVALHGLSIDEERGPFSPTLFTLPSDAALPPRQHVEQTWFAGTHADVGGGWPETALADIALLWMAEAAAATTGLAIDIDRLKRESAPDALGVQHFSATGRMYAFSRLVPFLRLVEQNIAGIPERRRRIFRSWRTSNVGKGLVSLNETIHESALQRLGQRVPEARGKDVREIVYQPPTLLAATGREPVTRPPAGDGDDGADGGEPDREGGAGAASIAKARDAPAPIISAKPVPQRTLSAASEPAGQVVKEGVKKESVEAIVGKPAGEIASEAPRVAPARPQIATEAERKIETKPEIIEAKPEIKIDRDPPPSPAAAAESVTTVRPKGADMPEPRPAPDGRDPLKPETPVAAERPAVSEKVSARASGKVKVVTVHGTGAGVAADTGASWWQKDSAFQKKLCEIVELVGDDVEVVPFHWGTGPNSETKRREAGKALHALLRGYDADGTDYYVIGHSHGGSVTYDALLHSAAKSEPLERLKSWFTIGSPFLDFQPSKLLFSRLNLWGQVIYVTGVGFLLTALGLLASRILDLKFAQSVSGVLGDAADSKFYVPVLAFMFGYVALCWAGLFIAERLTRHWYSDAQKAKTRDLYEKSWVGFWHRDDEAISSLANVSSLNKAIIPTNFLVAAFSVIPLLITIAGVGYILYLLVHSSGADSPWLKNFFTELAAADTQREFHWDLGSLIAIAHDLVMVIVFIMGPILALYLLGTTIGVALFSVFARLIGIPLAKAIDNLVWDSVRQETWGNDRHGEHVRKVSSHPPLFTPRYVALPDAVATKIAANSETYATETMHKVRELLGVTALTPSSDIGHDLSQQLSWQGLIHTTYFDNEEFIALMAAALRRAGLNAAKSKRTPSSIGDDVALEWLTAIGTLPSPAPATAAV